MMDLQEARAALIAVRELFPDAIWVPSSDPGFVLALLCRELMNDYEKKNGVLVIDIGGGTTGYAVYSDNYLVSAGVIGVGGDHITNDIAHAFSTTNAQAEEIKIKEASATPISSETGSARVKIPGSNPLMETRTISRKALDTVVNARVKELFAILREKLEAEDLLHRLHSGAVITGGGAGLKDIDMVIRHELGMDVRHGTPIHVDGLADEVGKLHGISFHIINGKIGSQVGTLLGFRRSFPGSCGFFCCRSFRFRGFGCIQFCQNIHNTHGFASFWCNFD